MEHQTESRSSEERYVTMIRRDCWRGTSILLTLMATTVGGCADKESTDTTQVASSRQALTSANSAAPSSSATTTSSSASSCRSLSSSGAPLSSSLCTFTAWATRGQVQVRRSSRRNGRCANLSGAGPIICLHYGGWFAVAGRARETPRHIPRCKSGSRPRRAVHGCSKGADAESSKEDGGNQGSLQSRPG